MNDMRLINRLLRSHTGIGWDVDGTILSHEASQIMHRYILENPSKRHFIVTFRSHGDEMRIFSDMALLYARFPQSKVFEKIINIPDHLYEAYAVAHHTTRDGPQDPRIVEYVEWKGRVCHEHGITVLIDDMTNQVIRGCDRYGIQHIHPDEFGAQN